ncbi:DUF5993 family protein [Pannonibacter sp.]|uniref:DUF5993 family protein n=1 Tax=Pannonibacter sp. TaxID=1906786 RepID=UPI003F6EF250
MTTLIFALLTAAFWVAATDRARTASLLFALALVVGLVWFNHHMTDPLAISL